MREKLLITLSVIFFLCTVKIQSQTLSWAKSFGGNEFDVPTSTIVDDFGNVYTVGGFAGTADFNPNSGTTNVTSNGSADVYIQKLDSDGNLVWIKSLGGPGQDFGLSIEKDDSNNIYVVGSFSDTVDFDLGAGVDNVSSNGGFDAFLLKLNPDGDLLLKRTFGGIGSDEPNSISIDSNNAIYVAGEFQETVDFDPGVNTTNVSAIAGNGTDLFVLKLDLNADFLWVKSIGGNGDDPVLQPGITGATGVTSGPNGNIYLTGFYTRDTDFDPGAGVVELPNNGSYSMFVLKLDTNGNYLWAKSTGGDNDTEGRAIAVDNSGNVYTTGYFFNIVDFDPGDGVNNLTSNGSFESYVQKLNSFGDFVWARSFGSINQDIGNSIIIDSSENVYVSGRFSDIVDFDPSNSVVNLTSAGSLDIFILRLTANGDLAWAQSMGSDSVDEGSTVTIDSEENLYLAGRFSNTLTFDFGNGSNSLTSNGNYDSFILKFSSNTLSNNDEVLSKISYFPNPTDEKLTVISEENFKISVYDTNGRVVKEVNKTSREFSFYLKNVSPGLYILKGENLKDSFYKKIIVK